MGKSIQAPTVMPKQTVWLPEIPEGFCPAIIYSLTSTRTHRK